MLLFTKTSLNLSWKDFAKQLGIGQTTLREWRDEKWSIRANAFDKILLVCPECQSFVGFITKSKDDDWGRKLGGIRTKKRRHGFLDPKYDKQSSEWKSKGGKIGTRNWHSRMKMEHPQEYRQIQYNRIKQSLKYKHEYRGRKYRNLLELEVAKILTKQKVTFEYEKLLSCEGKFYFPDFIFAETIVECTFWYDVSQKSAELRQKTEAYLKGNFKMVFIVTTSRYLDDYSRLLSASNVRVITPSGLSGLLDGKLGE